MSLRSKLAPCVPDWAALGARGPEDLLAGDGMETAVAAQEVSRGEESSLFRLPLPGTPGQGLPPARPRGAGTGFVYLRRYPGVRLGHALRTRLTAPCSDSVALRDWNLLCHLRSAGIVTPEPLAWCARGGGFFAQQSALVTRALTGTRPVLEWLEAEEDPARRRLGVTALGLALSRLFRARVELPRLSLAHLHLSTARSQSRPDPGAGDCGAEQLLGMQSDASEAPFAAHLSWRRLPDVALMSVSAGRIVKRTQEHHVRQTLERLGGEAGDRPLRERLRVAILVRAGVSR
ncbi:MAG: lipopolysaccharide kinase InaA family protein [Planctomycetota bacterium]|nr:lipopolysaccharide kinase InaA family protein [Planctomycetota bacterium]